MSSLLPFPNENKGEQMRGVRAVDVMRKDVGEDMGDVDEESESDADVSSVNTEEQEDTEDEEEIGDETGEEGEGEELAFIGEEGEGEGEVMQLTKKPKQSNTKNVATYRKPNINTNANMGNIGYTAQTSELIKNIDSSLNDDSDTDYPDDKYLEKFSESMKTNYVEENHPETITHNYNEVKKLSEITVDANGNIIDDNHKTVPFITKYEKTRILGQRAKQIDAGAIPFVTVPPNIIDGYQIALIELREKKIPFIIKRPLPGNGGVEYWKVSDMIIL